MENLKQFNTMASDDNWRTQAFRQSVVSKIEEVIQLSGVQVARNSSEMENYVFMNVKTREEYMIVVAKLILHMRKICDIPDVVPIAVGCALGGLMVVVVLVAYLIGRRRSAARGYLPM